ncbi:TetR/AcrR family transcriptional regulator [Pseudomonas typographi]|uniref:TetR/AcrR family transcriptional regulator n=1 Tax=Pseudomonas typographi TaxID=2715964 RepID=UPI00168220E7|nr:TetR/AcrR family transcriptional regulator [Pseudomonas typographi]MBD1552450.1 TetR/AcrR family transcriptional regulator [Pseudomonas typographi]MBD1585540.1 TetR/AcrR family transcriptional regulator [Pseudomonas typographi]
MPNAPSKRRGRPPKACAVKPDAIIQAALRSFAAHGFEGASLRRIAATANVDVALIAHRHGAKLELWKAVVDDIAGQFVGQLSRPRNPVDATGATSMERLLHAIDQMIDFSADAPEMSMFVLKEVAQQDARFHYLYERLIKPVQEVLLPTVEQAIHDGFLKGVNGNLFFYNLSGAIALTLSLRPFIEQFDVEVFSSQLFSQRMKTLWRALLYPG